MSGAPKNAPIGPRLQKGGKKKVRNLHYMLTGFPDAAHIDGKTSTNKQEEAFLAVKRRHKQQRYRLLKHHTEIYRQWKQDTQKSIDFNTCLQSYHSVTRPANMMLPGSFEQISSPAAKSILEKLPADKRTVLVSIDQLHLPHNLTDKEEYRANELSSAEFAAEISKQSVSMIYRMFAEEQELRLSQLEMEEKYFHVLCRTYPERYGNVPTPSLISSLSVKKNDTIPVKHVQVPQAPPQAETHSSSNKATDPRRPPPLTISKTPSSGNPQSAHSSHARRAEMQDSDRFRPPASATSYFAQPQPPQSSSSRLEYRPPANPYSRREEPSSSTGHGRTHPKLPSDPYRPAEEPSSRSNSYQSTSKGYKRPSASPQLPYTSPRSYPTKSPQWSEGGNFYRPGSSMDGAREAEDRRRVEEDGRRDIWRRGPDTSR